MASKEKLVEELEALDELEWFDVLGEATERRWKKLEQQEQPEEPRTGIAPRAFAEWIARRHLASDPGIREVVYLPHAPDKEIRLVEVNALLFATQMGEVEPLNFSPDIPGVDYRVLAADITPQQWEDIQKGKPLLPHGWELADRVIFGRKQCQ